MEKIEKRKEDIEREIIGTSIKEARDAIISKYLADLRVLEEKTNSIDYKYYRY